MTPKQRAWLDLPVDSSELDSQVARGVARTIPDVDTEHTGRTLGLALGLRDRRGGNDEVEWSDSSYAFGIDETGEFRDSEDPDLAPVTDVDESGQHVTVTNENGESAQYTDEYWTVIDEMRGNDGVNVEISEDAPAFVNLPDGSDIVVAPRIQN